MSPVMARRVSCRNAAIQSLSGEQRTFLARVRSVTFDPKRSSALQ